MSTEPHLHHEPRDLADRFALGLTRQLRWLADTFFAQRYGHRAVVLETIAAVPGMVGAMATHMRCLRRMVDDDGWIRTLMDEAENERMHLMTFIEIAKPTRLERILILVTQWIVYAGFFVLYLVSRRTAHRLVGYFEEEAVLSYTLYLAEIEAGRAPDVAAPAIARRYWQLAADATLRDVVRVVRDDEAHHRDVNHGFADQLSGRAADTPSNHPIGETMIQTAHITGTVEYREGDGANITIRRGPCEVEETAMDATISWTDGDSHGSAAMPLTIYRGYVASRAIRIDGVKRS